VDELHALWLVPVSHVACSRCRGHGTEVASAALHHRWFHLSGGTPL